MSNQHDNLKAGIFLLLGIFLVIGVVFLISWSRFQEFLHSAQPIAVYYPISNGLQGLSEGAAVTVGDVQIGSVSAIASHFNDDRIVGHVIHFEIPDSYEVGWNAVVELVVPILGSSTTLNFRSLGQPPDYDPFHAMPEAVRHVVLPLPLRNHPFPDGTIPGRVASTLTRNLISSAMTSIGFEDEQRSQVTSILRRVDVLSAILVRRAERIGEKADRLLENADEAVADMRGLLDELNQRSPVWMARLDRITANSDETISAARNLVAGQFPKIDASLDTAHDVLDHLDAETLPKVDSVLESANVTMENVETISDSGRDLIVGQRPVIERAVANVHLMAEQLKLTAVEVRRSPWRLLYRPRESELETDNLYDSARSFAQAAASIEATIASIESLSGVNPEAFDRLQPQLEYLEALQRRFEEAEASFWDHLENVQQP